jgi:hypothetical protein
MTGQTQSVFSRTEIEACNTQLLEE